MAIRSLKSGTFSRSGMVGNPVIMPGSYESIATVTVGAGGASSVVFSSIPSTYSHLQIRYLVRSTYAAGSDIVLARANGDSGNNYAAHRVYGDGSTKGAQGFTPQTYFLGPDCTAASSGANMFGTGVFDILDFANTNKNKTMRASGGRDENGSGYVWLNSGLWINTSAITSITVIAGNGTLAQHSSIALYGVN
jgi:hypothetical protein